MGNDGMSPEIALPYCVQSIPILWCQVGGVGAEPIQLTMEEMELGQSGEIKTMGQVTGERITAQRELQKSSEGPFWCLH